LFITLGLTTAFEVKGKDQAEKQAFRAKIPDGLYLFQVYMGEDIFSPLVLVEGGKLIDPYARARKMGLAKFSQTYLEGKSFNVYTGTEKIGSVSKVRLAWKEPCLTNQFAPGLEGKVSFAEHLLPKVYSRNILTEIGHPVYEEVRAILTPASFHVSKIVPHFIVTDLEKTEMIDALYRDVLPSIIQLSKEFRSGGKEVGHLQVAQALDFDGNGQKDVLGAYVLNFATGIENILFILRDTGHAEKIILTKGLTPAFVFGGTLDVDQDGILEIVVQTKISPPKDPMDNGREVAIWRHDSSGWTNIYHTLQVGCSWKTDY
jgi:hypothetical protein